MTGNLKLPVPDPRDPGSGVRHDLRHGLATIRTLFAVAGDAPTLEPGEIRRLVATANGEIAYALDLLDALPTAPASVENLPLEPLPLPSTATPHSDVDGVLRAAAAAGGSSGRRIIVDTVSPLHAAMPRLPLTRIVRNLLGNALAATPAGGTVRLVGLHGSRCADGERGSTDFHVRLEVHDEGPGPGRVGFHRGGGLGLDVVRSLVLPAGGWLVLGRSPFGGACATVALPAPAGEDA